MATTEYNLDDVQSHMLGLIVSIMNNYSLCPTDVDNYFQGMASYHTVASDHSNESICPNQIDDTDDECTTPLIVPDPPKTEKYLWANDGEMKHSWASDSGDSDQEETLFTPPTTPKEDKKMYVAHRRAFRDALSNNIKICSNYNDCSDDNCLRFHVLHENLCPHAGRNNYCDQTNCDKIVIKACRKGRRCTDGACSFRH